MHNASILIVENESVIALDIENTLKNLEYTVTGIVSSGAECMENISFNRPDLVLMDINLDGETTGIEAAGEIRKKYNIPIIYVTAYSGESYLQNAKLTEPYGYIMKPVSREKLESTIEISLYRYNLDKKLRESETMLRRTEGIAGIGSWKIDTVANQVKWSDEMFRIFGISPEQFNGSIDSGINRIHPYDLENVLEVSQSSITAKKPYEVEYRIIHPDGNVLNVVAKGDIVCNGKGDVIEVIGSVQDITDRKRSEEKIKYLNSLLFAIRNINHIITHEKNSEKLTQTTCDSLIETRGYSSSWIALFNDSSGFIAVSHAGHDDEIFSVLYENLNKNIIIPCVQKTLTQSEIVAVKHPSGFCSDCPILYKTRCMDSLLVRLECNNNIYGVLAVRNESIHPDNDEEQILLKELADDIAFALYTIELEQERRKLQQQLVHSEKLSAVGQLAAGVAHEFNNLLNIILGHAQISLMEDLSDGIKNSIEVIEKVSRRGSDMVKKLGAFAKPKEPDFKTEFITELIDDVIKIQEKQFLLDNIEIIRDYIHNPKVSFDRGQLEQVFLNLLKNAAHAIKPEGRGKISISVKNINSNSEIKISDTGIGMDEKTKIKIFEPFFTTKGGLAKDGLGIAGTGLGLSVTHTIIRQHNGTISVESEKDKGTTFIITLPIDEADVIHEYKIKQPLIDKEIKKLHNLRILIVDDEKDTVELMKLVFRKAGFQKIMVEESGKQAISVFKSFKPDIVFLDILMPDMNGEKVFQEMRSYNKKIPIVFMTGKIDTDEKKFLENGAYDFIHKPFDIKRIYDVVKNIAGEKL